MFRKTKKFSINLARFLGKNLLGQKLGTRIIVFVYRITDAPILHIALNHYGICKFGDFEDTGEKFVLTKIVLPNLEKNEYILDIGANVGGYGQLIESLVPDQPMASIEPNPLAFGRLENNVNHKCYNIAISLNSASVKLFIPKNDLLSTQASLIDFEDSLGDVKEIYVESLSLLDFLEKAKMSSVGFLKVDAEGNDFEVIKSGGSKVQLFKFIQFEFNQYHVYSRTFLKDFFDLLSTSHSLYRIDENALHDLQEYDVRYEIFRYQNLLAIRKDIVSEALFEIKLKKLI